MRCVLVSEIHTIREALLCMQMMVEAQQLVSGQYPAAITILASALFHDSALCMVSGF